VFIFGATTVVSIHRHDATANILVSIIRTNNRTKFSANRRTCVYIFVGSEHAWDKSDEEDILQNVSKTMERLVGFDICMARFTSLREYGFGSK